MGWSGSSGSRGLSFSMKPCSAESINAICTLYSLDCKISLQLEPQKANNNESWFRW